MVDSNEKLDSSTLQYFCHLLESGLARINWIQAVDKFCVEQLISCQKCWLIDCQAIEFWAVHPHSVVLLYIFFENCFSYVEQSDLQISFIFKDVFLSALCVCLCPYQK